MQELKTFPIEEIESYLDNCQIVPGSGVYHDFSQSPTPITQQKSKSFFSIIILVIVIIIIFGIVIGLIYYFSKPKEKQYTDDIKGDIKGDVKGDTTELLSNQSNIPVVTIAQPQNQIQI